MINAPIELDIYVTNEDIRQKQKLESVEIIRQDSKRYELFDDFDIRICYQWNRRTCKILKDGEKYSAEYKIKIDEEYKKQVIDVLKSVNLVDELKCTTMLKIQQFHIINILRKYIPNIK